MKKIVAVIVTVLFFAELYAQPKGCSDSIVFNKFSPILFEYFNNALNTPAQRDSADNIFLGGSYGFYIGTSNDLTSVLKFNKDNNPVWAKWYRPASNNSIIKNLGSLVAIDGNANLFFTGYSVNIPVPGKMLITKIDSTGSLIWVKQISYAIPSIYEVVYGGAPGIPLPAGNNLFFYTPDGDITALNTNGNILWAKKYGIINSSGFIRAATTISAMGNNSLLVCIAGFTSPSGAANDPNAQHYVHFAKINSSTGAVMQQKTLSYFADAGLTNVFRLEPTKLNYDDASGSVVLISLPYVNATGQGRVNKQVYCKLDSNFNPITTAYIYSNGVFLPTYSGNEIFLNLSKKNETSFVYQEYEATNATIDKLNYITVNSNLQITAQRKIDYAPFGFPAAPAKTTIGFKKDGTLNFQSGCNSVTQGTLLIYDHIPFYNTLSPCLGYDTTFFYNSPAYAQQVTSLNYQDTANIAVTITDVVPDGAFVDYTLPKTEICKQVSICDTIKITGNSFYCPGTATQRFTLVRNPLCKRVTVWQVDTNNIKIISKTDTTLSVQFLNAYNGFIKVSFAGCTLSDSLPIHVYSIPPAGVNLGNDVLACPGTPVTFNAGAGFKTYLWQNNSTGQNYTATQPGKYYVTVTDSCGRVYSDTVQVLVAAVVRPNLGNDTMHCPGKTITLNPGAGFKSYVWQNNSTTTTFVAVQPGKYYVTVTDSCNISYSDTIYVQPQDAALAVAFTRAICSWDTAIVTLPTLFTNYAWQPKPLATLGNSNQWYMYPGTTTLYTLSGQRPTGCDITDTVLIKVNQCPDYIFFPNAFTPNGDGINDTYKPYNGGRFVYYDFTIYNRYGQPVFKSNSPQNAWNGNVKGGNKPITGSYVWVCNYQFAGQQKVQKKGAVTLIR